MEEAAVKMRHKGKFTSQYFFNFRKRRKERGVEKDTTQEKGEEARKAENKKRKDLIQDRKSQENTLKMKSLIQCIKPWTWIQSFMVASKILRKKRKSINPVIDLKIYKNK
jgi:hypothetical protein